MSRPTDALGNPLTTWEGQGDGTYIETRPDGATRRVRIRDGQIWPADDEQEDEEDG
jgi:hypothetical protein